MANLPRVNAFVNKMVDDESSAGTLSNATSVSSVSSKRFEQELDGEYGEIEQYLKHTNWNEDEELYLIEPVPMSFDMGVNKKISVCCSFQRCCKNTGFSDTDKPSNEYLLGIAFISFLVFTILQSIAATIAKSESMKGDSFAMAVDAFTYGFNLFAEWMKNKNRSLTQVGLISPGIEKQNAIRSRQKMNLLLELIPPLISVITLVFVIIFILKKSIGTLILDSNRAKEEQGKPNVIVMFSFSVGNLLLDFLNVFCFAKADHALGYNTHIQLEEDEETEERKCKKIKSKMCAAHDDDPFNQAKVHFDKNMSEIEISTTASQTYDSGDDEMLSDIEMKPILSPMHTIVAQGSEAKHYNQTETNLHVSQEVEEANLNMCSAYTHVFADTIRSIAVLIASILAEFVESVTPEEADAVAAVIVSGIILLALLPLLAGIKRTWVSFYSIRQEELAKVSVV